jgi:hypothetical protein
MTTRSSGKTLRQSFCRTASHSCFSSTSERKLLKPRTTCLAEGVRRPRAGQAGDVTLQQVIPGASVPDQNAVACSFGGFWRGRPPCLATMFRHKSTDVGEKYTSLNTGCSIGLRQRAPSPSGSLRSTDPRVSPWSDPRVHDRPETRTVTQEPRGNNSKRDATMNLPDRCHRITHVGQLGGRTIRCG